MLDAPRQVAIAGAGIAGLTAAIAFAERGYNVQIFEQASRLDATGAGIQLSPNATRILAQLDVLDLLLPHAVHPAAVLLKDATTLRLLARVPLGESAERRWRAPYLVVHRSDLQNALLARVAAFPGIKLLTDARVTEAKAVGKDIEASLEIHGKTGTVACTLLICADGVWSRLRGLCRPSSESRFSGELAWRATVAADSPAGIEFSAIASTDCVTAFLRGGFHLVAYPMSGGKAFNLVAFTKGGRIAEDWSGKADRSILDAALRNASPALGRLVGEAGPWTAWPVHTVDARQRWIAPAGIALVGDAAHAMTPFAAQGAAMAIEDAATLATAVVAQPGDLEAALTGWERLRRSRVARVARRGALNRLAWHAAGPVAVARNLYLKMRSPEQLAADLDWLYGWEMPEDNPAEPSVV